MEGAWYCYIGTNLMTILSRHLLVFYLKHFSGKALIVVFLSDNGSKKKLSFKTTTDASVSQIVEAMQKIASHIGNPAKFNKASKLAIQLIEAGSVKPETADQFFALLEAAMLSSTCNDASVRSDYHALFSAAQDAKEVCYPIHFSGYLYSLFVIGVF